MLNKNWWNKEWQKWPSIKENAYDKYVFNNKLKKHIVPYGSFVLITGKRRETEHLTELLIETSELVKKLNYVYKKAGSPTAEEVLKRYRDAINKDPYAKEWPQLDNWWEENTKCIIDLL